MGNGATNCACAKRWKAIRDKFLKEVKKRKSCSGDEGPPFKSNWPLFNMLLFLSESVRHGLYVLLIDDCILLYSFLFFSLSTLSNFGQGSSQVESHEKNVQDTQGLSGISKVHVNSDLDDRYTQFICMNIV